MNEQREFIVSSFFGFPLSILILGVLLFVALVQRSAGLASIAGTVLLLMVGSSLWTRCAPYRLSLLFHLDRHRLFPGEVAQLEVTLRNSKPLPFFLSIEGPFHLLGQTIVMPFSELHHAWNIPLTRRGVYPLKACTLSFGDPFGLTSTRRTLPLHEEIVVYPRLKRIEDSIAQFQEFFGLHPAKGLVEDPAAYAGTRDYTGFRPARFIHWKASARIGKIQEKIFEPTSHAKILVIVKVEGFARQLSRLGSQDPSRANGSVTRKDVEDAFETLLERVASYAYLSFQQGASLAFVTDGELVEDPEPFLPMGSGYEHLGRFLEKLARLRFPSPYEESSKLSREGPHPVMKGSTPPMESPKAASGEFYRIAREVGRWGTGYIYACYKPAEGEHARQFLSPHRRSRLLILPATGKAEVKDG